MEKPEFQNRIHELFNMRVSLERALSYLPVGSEYATLIRIQLDQVNREIDGIYDQALIHIDEEIAALAASSKKKDLK